MRFHVEHTIAAPLDAVEAAILDVTTGATLSRNSPVTYDDQVLERRDCGKVVVRVVRRRARNLRSLVADRWLPDGAMWIESTMWRRDTHAGTFVIQPFIATWLDGRVRCWGQYTLRSQNAQTLRIVDGEMQVDAPLIGAAIERTVVSLLGRHFAVEARLLEGLASRPRPRLALVTRGG